MNNLRKLFTTLKPTNIKNSISQAYQTWKSQGGARPDPLKEYFDKFVQQAPIKKKPMTRDEAFKVLSINDKPDITSDEILESYVRQFTKNSPAQGGSFYLQSKVWCAKEELMKTFPGVEKEYYTKNEISDPVKGAKRPKETDEKADVKADAKADTKADAKTSTKSEAKPETKAEQKPNTEEKKKE